MNQPTFQCPKCGFSSTSPEMCDACGALISRIQVRQVEPSIEVEDDADSDFEEGEVAAPSALASRLSRIVVGLGAVGVAVVAALFFRSIMPAPPSAPMLELGGAEFEARVISAPSTQTWILDFWAPWCGPCKHFGPEFAAAASDLSARAMFAKVNVDDNPEIGGRFEVQSIPTVLIVRGGKEVQRATGAMGRDELRRWVERHL